MNIEIFIKIHGMSVEIMKLYFRANDKVNTKISITIDGAPGELLFPKERARQRM